MNTIYLLQFVQLPVKVEHFDAAMVHVLAPLIAVMGIETALMAVMRLVVVSPLNYLVWGVRMHIVVMVFIYEDKVVAVSILLLYSVLKCIKWGWAPQHLKCRLITLHS